MTDLAEFLTGRYDEAEAAAHAAADETRGERWYASNDGVFEAEQGSHAIVVDGYGFLPTAVGDYIAYHDPARVLADVAAKRRVLTRHRTAREGEWQRWHARMCMGCGTMGEFDDPRVREINECPELRDLAAPYAEHPDYDQAWRADG